MTSIERVGEPTIDERGDRLFATFKLSESPDKKWIQHFKDRAVFSIFPMANSVFKMDEVHIELPREEDLPVLTKSVDRFIVEANAQYKNGETEGNDE